MSKKSRRRARQARARQAIRVTPLRWGGAPAFSSMLKTVADSMPSMLGLMTTAFGGVGVCMSALGTPWPKPVADAVRRRDSLPLLVYADWCAENGRPEAEASARRLAAEFTKPPPAFKLSTALTRPPAPPPPPSAG